MEMKDSRKRKLKFDNTSTLEGLTAGQNSKKSKVDAPVPTTAIAIPSDGRKGKSSKRRRRREKAHSSAVAKDGEAKSVPPASAFSKATIEAPRKAIATQESSNAAAKSERHLDSARKQRKKARIREKRIAAKAAKANVSATTTSTSTVSIKEAASVTNLVQPRDKSWHDEKSAAATSEVEIGARRTKPAALPAAAQHMPLSPEIDWAAIEREAQKRIRQPDVDWKRLSSDQIRDLEIHYIGPCRVQGDQTVKPFERQAKVATDARRVAEQNHDGSTQHSGDLVLTAPLQASSQTFRQTQKSEPFQPYRERRLSGVPTTTGSGDLQDTTARFQRFSQMVNGSDSSESGSDESSSESEGEHKTSSEEGLEKPVRGSIQESFADEMFKEESDSRAMTSSPESEGEFNTTALDEAARQYESYMRSRTIAGSSRDPTKASGASPGFQDEVLDVRPQSAGLAATWDATMDGDATPELLGPTNDDSGGERGVLESPTRSEEGTGSDDESPSSDDEEEEPMLDPSAEEIDKIGTPTQTPGPPVPHNTSPQTTEEEPESEPEDVVPSTDKVDDRVMASNNPPGDEAEAMGLLDSLQQDLDAMPATSIEMKDCPGVGEHEMEEAHAIPNLEQLQHMKKYITDAEPEAGNSYGLNEEVGIEHSRSSQEVPQTGILTEPPLATAANVALKKRPQRQEAGGPRSLSGRSPDPPAQVRPEHQGSTKSGMNERHAEQDVEGLYSELDHITQELFSTTRSINNVAGHERAQSVLTSADQTDSDLPADIREAMADATASSPPTSASKRKMTGMTSKHFSPAKCTKASTRATAGTSSAARALSSFTPVKTFDQIPKRIAYVDLGLIRKESGDSTRSTGLRNDDQEKRRRQGVDAESHIQQHISKFEITSDGGIENMPSVTRAQNSAQTPNQKRGGSSASGDDGVDATEQPNQRIAKMPSAEQTPSRKKKSPAKKTGTISEHFIEDRVDLYNTTAGKRRRVAAGESANPFPPIDKPFFGIIQERTWHEPFWLIIATVFLNKTTGRQAAPTFWKIRQRWPQPRILAKTDPAELFDMIAHLGLQNQRTKRILQLAAAWTANPPVKGHRTRKLNYPDKGDGKQWKKDEIVEQDADDCAGALEIAHIPGCGAYAYDSWRIFCRDVLRGVATDYKGANAKSPDFEPEWKRVLPADKELRACLRWMWLKEGWIWNPLTGEKRQATEDEMEKARKGEVEVEDEDERRFAAQAAGAEVQSPEKTRRGDDALDETPIKKAGSVEAGVDQGSDWALQTSQVEHAQPEVVVQRNIVDSPPVRQTRGSKRKRTEEETCASIAKSEAPPIAKKAKKEAVALRGKGSGRRSTRQSARLVTNSGIELNMLDE